MEAAQKILIVDDEPDILRGLKYNFEFEGFQVETAEDGISGFEKLTTESYNLAILDVMMPGMSGFDLCKAIRQKGVKIPVILLTAKGEEIDKVLGLELGADDYITKPFSLRELLARVKAVLRRSTNTDDSPTDKIEVGNLHVDLKTFEATSKGDPIKMSSREIEILNYLFQRSEQTVDRYEMMESLWDTRSEVTTRTIDNFIVKLRQKIEDDPSNPRHIITIHGKGYKLTV